MTDQAAIKLDELTTMIEARARKELKDELAGIIEGALANKVEIRASLEPAGWAAAYFEGEADILVFVLRLLGRTQAYPDYNKQEIK